MRLVIDTNLVFSAILKPSSFISEVIDRSDLDFFAPDFLQTEINKYQEKIIRLAGYTAADFEYQKRHVFKRITFFRESQISLEKINSGKDWVAAIDPKDYIFVALAEELNSTLWTGDKKLFDGLVAKTYPRIITTEGLKLLLSS